MSGFRCRVSGKSEESREDRGDLSAVGAIFVAETLLEFTVFKVEHDRAGEGGEDGKDDQRDCGEGDRPAQEFAEVAQVDGVADAGADAGGDETLVVAIGFEFGEAAELDVCEVARRRAIDQKAGEDEERAGNVGIRSFVESACAPGENEDDREDDVEEPEREDDLERPTPLSAPVFGKGMEREPKEGNRGIDGADIEREFGEEEMHEGSVLNIAFDLRGDLEGLGFY